MSHLQTCINEGVGAQHDIAQLRVAQHAALADERVVQLAVAHNRWRAEGACVQRVQRQQKPD